MPLVKTVLVGSSIEEFRRISVEMIKDGWLPVGKDQTDGYGKTRQAFTRYEKIDHAIMPLAFDESRGFLNRTLDDLRASGKYCPDIYDQAIAACQRLINDLMLAREAQRAARGLPKLTSEFTPAEIAENKANYDKQYARYLEASKSPASPAPDA